MSNVRVALRVRPLTKKEEENGSACIVQVNGETLSITNAKVVGIPEYGDSRERVKHFGFDHCYDSMEDSSSPDYASQQQVFQDLGTEVLQAAFGGFNACVFAYGQTGTGKTFTMMGYEGEVGLIPRICEGLFSHVDDCVGDKVSFRVDISYFEIYNERVRDLLQPELFKHNEKYTLKVREHPKEGPYVQDLSNHRVKDKKEIQALLERGNDYRVTAATYMHDHSSRSHAIVTISFTQARLEANMPSEIVSKIHLVDLAGSERADPSSHSNFRQRLKEGANINKSLVTLGYVIKALAERSLLSWSTDDMGSLQDFNRSGAGETMATPTSGPNKQRIPYIPYRDSVLTWLLKDSLGGNSKTIMIATITPASRYYNETISTLRYAQRAKSIINKPRVNEDSNVTLIRELRKEIERLRGMLASAQMYMSLMAELGEGPPQSKPAPSQAPPLSHPPTFRPNLNQPPPNPMGFNPPWQTRPALGGQMNQPPPSLGAQPQPLGGQPHLQPPRIQPPQLLQTTHQPQTQPGLGITQQAAIQQGLLQQQQQALQQQQQQRLQIPPGIQPVQPPSHPPASLSSQIPQLAQLPLGGGPAPVAPPAVNQMTSLPSISAAPMQPPWQSIAASSAPGSQFSTVMSSSAPTMGVPPPMLSAPPPPPPSSQTAITTTLPWLQQTQGAVPPPPPASSAPVSLSAPAPWQTSAAPPPPPSNIPPWQQQMAPPVQPPMSSNIAPPPPPPSSQPGFGHLGAPPPPPPGGFDVSSLSGGVNPLLVAPPPPPPN